MAIHTNSRRTSSSRPPSRTRRRRFPARFGAPVARCAHRHRRAAEPAAADAPRDHRSPPREVLIRRRTILRSLALAPLAALGDLRPAFAALRTPDPALAAVEATKAALAAYGAAVSLTDDIAGMQEGRFITLEDQAVFDRTSEA